MTLSVGLNHSNRLSVSTRAYHDIVVHVY